MLGLSRKVGERVYIYDPSGREIVRIELARIKNRNEANILIDAPKNYSIVRDDAKKVKELKSNVSTN